MHTLLYVFTVLSFAQLINISQALGLEALTPCVLTASNGAVVQAYCEETITPCVLTASNGAIVQAYCETSLVSQPFASITGASALQNTTSSTSIFQIFSTHSNIVSKAMLVLGNDIFLNISRYLIMGVQTPLHISRPRVRKTHPHRAQTSPLRPAHFFHLQIPSALP